MPKARIEVYGLRGNKADQLGFKVVGAIREKAYWEDVEVTVIDSASLFQQATPYLRLVTVWNENTSDIIKTLLPLGLRIEKLWLDGSVEPVEEENVAPPPAEDVPANLMVFTVKVDNAIEEKAMFHGTCNKDLVVTSPMDKSVRVQCPWCGVKAEVTNGEAIKALLDVYVEKPIECPVKLIDREGKQQDGKMIIKRRYDDST